MLNLVRDCLLFLAFLLFLPCFSLFQAFLQFPRMLQGAARVGTHDSVGSSMITSSEKVPPAPLDHSQLLNS